MTLAAPTLWSGNGPRWCFNQPPVRKLLDEAQPPALQIHTTPDGLVVGGPSLTRDIRLAYPQTDPWWAVAGDVGAPHPNWTGPAKAAVDNGVSTLVLNCESAWMDVPNDIVRAEIERVAKVAPTLRLAFSSFGQPGRAPNLFPPPTTTGRGGNFPLSGFVGLKSPWISLDLPQVYWDDAAVPDTWGRGMRSLARSIGCYAVEVANNNVRPGLVGRGVYLQLHGLRCDNLCAVAVTASVAAWWCLQPLYLQPGGCDALRAVCELHRLGYEGGDAIVNFQAAKGLDVDNRVGPKTLAALGITPWA